MKASKTRILTAITLILVIFMAILYVQFRPSVAEGEKSISISVIYEDGSQEDYSLQTTANYLKEAAETILTLEGEESSYGFTIYSVNGVEANFNTDSVYWAIYHNGKHGQYSIDSQPITDGDVFTLAYEHY